MPLSQCIVLENSDYKHFLSWVWFRVYRPIWNLKALCIVLFETIDLHLYFEKFAKNRTLWGRPRKCYHICLFMYIYVSPSSGRLLLNLKIILLSKKFEWIIHSIYGMKKFHSLRSEFHSILTPVEWIFCTQRVESRPVHSIIGSFRLYVNEDIVTPCLSSAPSSTGYCERRHRWKTWNRSVWSSRFG